MNDPDPASHNFLRFRMRTMFAAITILALILAWIGRDFIRTMHERPVITAISAAGGTVGYEHEVDPEFKLLDSSRPPPGSTLTRTLFGRNIRACAVAVAFDGGVGSDADLADLHQLKKLTDVVLSGPGFTDLAIPCLLKIGGLRSIVLSNTGISPTGFLELSKSRSLQGVTLIGPLTTDAHIKALNHCSSLTYVRLIKTAISDDAMASFRLMNNLTGLCIYSGFITDSGVEHLREMQTLRELRIAFIPITDRSLQTVGTLNNLEILHLNSTSITDDGIRALSAHHSIQHLNISHTEITDKAMRHLSGMACLATLNVVGTAVTSAGIDAVSELSPACKIRFDDTANENK